jgi:hypothetical protein
MRGRGLALIAACLCVFLGAGSIFGFSALQEALLRGQLFETLCARGEAHPCPAQLDRLALLFSLGVGVLYCAVMPVGLAMDEFGPGPVMFFGALFASAGFLVVALFPAADLAWSLAIPLWGACSPCLFLSALALPRFFGPRASAATMLVICCFDTGSAVFLGLLLLPSSPQIVLGVVSGALLAAGVVGGLTLPSAAEIRGLDELSDAEAHSELQPVSASLKRVDFWLATLFIAIWSMKNSFYLASFEPIWKSFDPTGSATAVFILNCALPVAGILSLPVGMVLFKLSNPWLFTAIALVGITYSVLNFPANSVVQYCGVAVYALMRPLKWGVVSHYVLSSFPLYNCGRLFGVLNVATGVVSCLQYAGVAIAVRTGSYFEVLLCFTILGASTLIAPVYFACAKRQRA